MVELRKPNPYKNISKAYKSIINSYSNLFRIQRIMGIFSMVIFFWLGYLYGISGDYELGLVFMIIFLALIISLEIKK